jgi:uncharacterized membrane protein YcgQ (UPF0703/DUF1980 family)
MIHYFHHYKKNVFKNCLSEIIMHTIYNKKTHHHDFNNLSSVSRAVPLVLKISLGFSCKNKALMNFAVLTQSAIFDVTEAEKVKRFHEVSDL